MSDTVKTILVAIDPESRQSHRPSARPFDWRPRCRQNWSPSRLRPAMRATCIGGKSPMPNEQMSQPFKNCLQEADKMAASLGQSVRTVHRVGDPAEEIVALAEEEGAGLLLMGYPKRSYVERVLLGRTTAKVIGMSPCDVLMIPENAEVNFARILVGVDGSRYSMEAGQRALDLALSYGGEVHALTVLDIPVDRSLLLRGAR